MIEPFLLRALLAGVGVAIMAGALGCFVIWRRMAYFGDSIAHSALLGVALGLLIGLHLPVAVLIVCASVALFLAWLRRLFAMDALLGIAAHAALATGVLAVSIAGKNLDLHSYLFGDILFVSTADLYWIGGSGILALIFLLTYWQPLILMTLNEDMAAAEGIHCRRINMGLLLLMTLIIAASVRTVGVLLITSMLIIPAAAARQFAASPVGMAFIAMLFGVISVFVGIFGSLYFDLPASPAIISFATVIFALSLIIGRRRF